MNVIRLKLTADKQKTLMFKLQHDLDQGRFYQKIDCASLYEMK